MTTPMFFTEPEALLVVWTSVVSAFLRVHLGEPEVLGGLVQLLDGGAVTGQRRVSVLEGVVQQGLAVLQVTAGLEQHGARGHGADSHALHDSFADLGDLVVGLLDAGLGLFAGLVQLLPQRRAEAGGVREYIDERLAQDPHQR